MTETIVSARVTGQELLPIIEKLETQLQGEDRTKGIIACLVTAVVQMKPDIDSEQLQGAIRGMSDWVALYLTTLDTMDESGHTKEVLN